MNHGNPAPEVTRAERQKAMTLKIDGIEYVPEDKEIKAVAIEKWYDRSRREWVLYPIDEEGNQLVEARYGFSKAEANKIKKELEAEYNI